MMPYKQNRRSPSHQFNRSSPRIVRANGLGGGNKLGAVVAQAIKDHIIGLGWPIGATLGTETELLTRFGVSRATLREAFRQLEGQGLVEMRTGVGGGLIVCAPARTVAVQTLATYLELIGVGFAEVTEARAILEGLAGQMAARRIDAVGAEKLRSIKHERESLRKVDFAACLSFGIRIRELVAQLSGNPAIMMLIETADRYALDLMPAVSIQQSPKKQQVAYQLRAQDALINAVNSGNGPLAAKVSRDGLLAGSKYIASLLQRTGSKARARARTEKRMDNSAGRGGSTKLSQQTAVAIARDIANLPLNGERRLGLEPELQSRYGVSRAVLREALRILELHGLTRSQRGRRGGVTAGVPSSRYTLESASVYLRFVRLSTDALFEVFRELELVALELATRRTDKSAIASLRAALAKQLQLASDDPTWVTATDEFHNQLGDLCGNRVLALFLRILVVTSQDANMFQAGPAAKAAYDKSHAAIVSAIEKRDEVLARQYLAKHFSIAMRFRQFAKQKA